MGYPYQSDDYQQPNYNLSGSLVSKATSQPLLGQDWGTNVPLLSDTGYAQPNFSLGLQGNMGGFGNMVGEPGSGSNKGINWFGGKNPDGTVDPNYVGMGIGALQGFGNAYLGLRQYGLAKDQLAFSKESFNRNYAAQRQTTNTALDDRQHARVASNPNAYESVGTYMQKNGVR